MTRLIFLLFFLFSFMAQAKTETSLFTCEFSNEPSIELSDDKHILYTQFYIYGAHGSEDRNYTLLYFVGAPGEEFGERALVSHRFNPIQELEDNESQVSGSWIKLDKPGFVALSFFIDLETRKLDQQCEFQGKERYFPSYEARLSIQKKNGEVAETYELRCVQHSALFSLSYCE